MYLLLPKMMTNCLQLSTMMTYNIIMDNNKKICFIGHRNVNVEKIKFSLQTEIKKSIEDGYKIFIMGNHGDFDRLSLFICKELKKIYKDIKIIVVITSLGIFNKRKIDDEIFNPYLGVETKMYEIENEYYKNRITMSNKRMIEECQKLICYVDENRKSSGAKKHYYMQENVN